MKFVDINSLSQFLTNLKGIFEPKGSSNTAINTAKTYTDTTTSSHNTSTDAHANMGWLSSGDEIAGSPIPVDADTLNGHNAAYFDNQIAVIEQRMDRALVFEPQTLTPEQQAQARANIGATPAITGSAGDFVVIGADGNLTTKSLLYAEEVQF